jgi:hypothetical protein
MNMRHLCTLMLAILMVRCGDGSDVVFDAPETVVDCEDKPTPSVSLLALDAGADGTSLLVFGDVGTYSLAIRSLSVEGVPAIRETFNYSSWNLTLPESTFARSVQGTQVTLLVRGETPCEAFTATLTGELPEALREPEEPPPADSGAE